MPVYLLGPQLVFPPPEHAEPEGLLAIGGDLRTERLRLAYRSGIFPWYSEGEPIAWYSPDPRMVIRPDSVRVSRSLRRSVKRRGWRLSMDEAFGEVIETCATIRRPRERGTWITRAIRKAYTELHREGDAHSVEVWEGERLVGGLYGVAVGGCFCGESMFARAPDASKAAFVGLARQLDAWGYVLIDCQLPTEHLASLGGVVWRRRRFLTELARAVRLPGRPAPWSFENADS